MACFSIGSRKVGEDAPVFIVAELGANHNGEPTLARKMIKEAAVAGVDAVKFQTFITSSLLTDYERVITWGPPGNTKSEPVGKMFDRLSIPLDAYKELFDFAKQLGLIAFSTPFSLKEAHFLAGLDVPCFKISSSDVTYLELLKSVAGFKKPIFLSLGKSNLGEVDKAVSTLLDLDCQALALLHCVSQYPAPIEEINLQILSTLSVLYPNCVVGFSDHTLGLTSCLGATALGAKVIEKHFTLDHDLDGPDHWFSADPNELKQLVKQVRLLESALGKPNKRVLPCEEEERITSTRSLVLKVPVQAGTAITNEHLKIVRPGWGIHPYDEDKVIGLRIQYDLPAGTVLKWDHFR